MAGEVRSVSQAFAVLRLLADSDPLTLSDIGRSLGLGASSCFNLLGTLVAEGAVVRDQPGKRYRLSDGWARAGLLRDGDARRMIDRLRPLMARFAQAHEVTTGLWQVASRDRLQLVAHAESKAVLRIHLAQGQRQPLGGGAVGRAIAAAQAPGEEEVARRFAAVRWEKGIALADYYEQVRVAGGTGFAVDDGYTHIGICTLAAVVPWPGAEYCVSASCFAGVRKPVDLASLGRALVDLARSAVA